MAHDSTWSLTMWEGGTSGCVTRHARAGGCSVRLDVSLSRMDAADAPGYSGCADHRDLNRECCTITACKMHHGKRDVQEEQRASCATLYLREVLRCMHVMNVLTGAVVPQDIDDLRVLESVWVGVLRSS